MAPFISSKCGLYISYHFLIKLQRLVNKDRPLGLSQNTILNGKVVRLYLAGVVIVILREILTSSVMFSLEKTVNSTFCNLHSGLTSLLC